MKHFSSFYHKENRGVNSKDNYKLRGKTPVTSVNIETIEFNQRDLKMWRVI